MQVTLFHKENMLQHHCWFVAVFFAYQHFHCWEQISCYMTNNIVSTSDDTFMVCTKKVLPGLLPGYVADWIWTGVMVPLSPYIPYRLYILLLSEIFKIAFLGSRKVLQISRLEFIIIVIIIILYFISRLKNRASDTQHKDCQSERVINCLQYN